MAGVIFFLVFSGTFLGVGLFLFIGDLAGNLSGASGDPAWQVGLGFIIISSPLFAFATWSLRQAVRNRALPARPSYIKPAPARIFSQQRSHHRIWFVFTALWSTVPIAVGYFAIVARKDQFALGSIAVVFALVLVLLLWSGWKKVGTWHRFGAVPLHIERHPLTQGEALVAWLELRDAGMQRPEFLARLICEQVEYVRVSTNDGTSTRESVTEHWSTSSTIRGRPVGSRTRVEIRMDMPANQPATDIPGSLGTSSEQKRGVDYYRWVLRVESTSSRVGFTRDYPIEVQPPENAREPATVAQAQSVKESTMPDRHQVLSAQKVIGAELASGRSAADIWEHLAGLQLAPAVIRAGFAGAAGQASVQQAAVLRDFLAGQECEDAGTTLTSLGKGQFWDPLQGKVSARRMAQKEEDAEQEALERTRSGNRFFARTMALLNLLSRMADSGSSNPTLRAQLATFREAPARLRTTLWMLFAIPATTTLITYLFRDTILPVLSSANQGDARVLLLLPFAIPYLYIRRIYSLQTDLVKLEVAEANGWWYSASRNSKRGRRFNKRFGRLLPHENREKMTTEDEFWGTYESGRQTVHFWSGLIHYEVESNVRVNKQRRVKKYTWTTVALPLNRPLSHTLLIRAQPRRLRVLRRFFRGRVNVNTASAEFNRLFDVYRDGVEETDLQAILWILTPAVQVRLLDLYDREGEFAFLFHRNAIVFVFHGRLLKGMQTDFFRSLELAPDDRTRVQKRLGHVLSISGDIVPFLD